MIRIEAIGWETAEKVPERWWRGDDCWNKDTAVGEHAGCCGYEPLEMTENGCTAYGRAQRRNIVGRA